MLLLESGGRGGGRHKTSPQNFLHVFNPSYTKRFLSGGEKIGCGKAATKQLIPSLSHLISRTGKSVSILAQNAQNIRKMTQETDGICFMQKTARENS